MAKQAKKKKKIKRFTQKHRDLQATVIGIILTIMLIVLGYRVYWFQTGERGDELRIDSARQQNLSRRAAALRTVPAARGEIVDRNMLPLALSRPVYDIFIDVVELHNANNRNDAGRRELLEVRDAIVYHFNWTFSELDAHFALNNDGTLARRNHHLIVAREVEPALAYYLRDTFRHVHATPQTQRFYPAPTVAPQVVGFQRGGYFWGLESFYNTQLTGAPGRRFSAQGEVEEIPVRHGYTLVTTLDMEIQRLAQASVDRTYSEMDSVFVGALVMDPFTGEVFAMAQAPSFSLADEFDPHLTTDAWLKNNWDIMQENQQVTEMQRLWRNFHISYTYEPGSIFKPFVMAAALEEGVLDRNQYFFCSMFKEVFPGEPPLTCHSRCGSMNFRTALYRSCNVAMFYIVNMMGRDMFYRYRGYFGFGERTGIDLFGETCVSSPYLLYTRASLGPVQLATSSIGQGSNVTTIQAISAFSALINGGNLMQPFVVSHVLDSDGNIVQENHPTITRRVISPQTSDFMRTEMRYVVDSDRGTARTGRIPGHTVGGKTGTAQQGRRADNINTLTYIAFTPVENPELIVLKVVHRICGETYGGAGAELSPRTARLLEQIIAYRGMSPSDGPYAQEFWQHHTTAETMPDYAGWRLADAVNNLSNRSGHSGYQVIGTGTVVSHTIPEPGRPMPQNAPVFFHMETGTDLEGQMVFVPNLSGLTVTQARAVVREFGLTMIVLDSIGALGGTENGEARTTNPLTAEEWAELGGQTDQQEAINYVIYSQYPSVDTVIARGTPVMIRAR